MNKHRSVWLLVLIALLAALAGCGGGGGSDVAGVASSAVDTPADDTPATLDTSEPAPPSLRDGAAYTDTARPPGNPPPDGASADGTYNTWYVPNNAFDGNLNSWWVGAAGRGQWDLYYGFASARHIEQIGINFYSTSHTPTQVVLKTSADGLVWNTAGTFTAGNTNPWIVVNADIRYIWIQMDGNPAVGYPLIREVLWTTDLARMPSAGPGFNDYTYKAANAFDGNPDTWWVGKIDAGAWDIYYDYGSVSHLQMVNISYYSINYAPGTARLHTSTDGVNWTEAGRMGPGANASPYREYIYCGCDARYLRIEMIGNPASKYPLVKDMQMVFPDGASSGDSYSNFYHAAKAFDGDQNTWWTGKQGATEWNLFYKYTAPQGVGDVIINYYANTHAPTTTTLYKSNDGNAWTLVGTFPTGSSPILGVAATAKFLRIRLQGVPAVGYPVIKDITITPGNGTWAKTYGSDPGSEQPMAIRQTTGGGYITCVFGESHIKVLKLDAGGNVSWQKTYGGTVEDYCSDIQQTEDGGYIVLGETQNFGAINHDAYVIKLDAAGNEVWSHTYAGGSTNWDATGSIAQTADGGYVFSAWTWVGGSSVVKAWVVKLDASGNVIWSNKFGDVSQTLALSIVEVLNDNSDGDGGTSSSYVIAGSTNGDHGYWMMKIDASGNMLWEKNFGNGRANAVHQTPDGGFILAGWIISSSSSLNYFLVKTNASGVKEWEKEIVHPGQDEAHDVDITSDGGYFVTGFGMTVSSSYEYWPIKFDALGNQVWARGYSSGMTRAGVHTDDGGYIVAGRRYLPGIDDILILKLNENGECPGCGF